MNFNSIQFLFFLPVVLLLYWIIPQKIRWLLLLIASYYFYMSWNVWLVFLILTTTLVSYLSGLLLKKAKRKIEKNLLLLFTLLVCLGILFIFKYLNFILSQVSSIASTFGAQGEFQPLNLILPIGISFYTFQTLSYVIDVYKGKILPERHFGYYALYVCFFPQLVAGPIERPENLIPQLHSEKKLSFEYFTEGTKFLFSGFVKKVVIADFFAQFVNRVYASLPEANSLAVCFATVAFALQIYCDFSGYSDIAVGSARLMGIKLMKNFDRPYTACSIRDFWKRWHISLTSWFTDYIYIPLGGSRKGLIRRCLNIFIVFLVSGLWHGANWTFVVWGAIHGFYLVVQTLLTKPCKRWREKRNIAKNSPILLVLGRVLTFVFVCFAWIFFRANTLSDAVLAVGKIFTDFSGWSVFLSFTELTMIDTIECILLVLLLIALPFLPTLKESSLHTMNERTTEKSFVVCLYLLLAFVVATAWLILLSKNIESGFIYFQF